MQNIPLNLSYQQFLDHVGNIGDYYYYSVYELVKERLDGRTIHDYREFLEHVGNIHSAATKESPSFIGYYELFTRLYNL